jgi:hypothetical protein
VILKILSDVHGRITSASVWDGAGVHRKATSSISFELPARLIFQFALPAMEASKCIAGRRVEVRNGWILVDFRQGIASHRGKETLQVTIELQP